MDALRGLAYVVPIVNNVVRVHTGDGEVVGACTVPQNTTADKGLAYHVPR